MNFSLTIPPNTPESSPLTQTWETMLFKFNGFKINIPEGHKYLARIRIKTQGRILVPVYGSGEAWLRGNNETKDVPLPVALEGPPWCLTLEGFNEDDTYPHTFFVDTL